MKNFSRIAAGFVLGAATTFGFSAAAMGPHHGHGEGQHFARHMERMGKKLDLSAEQKASMKAIAEANRPELKELRQQLRGERQALGELLKSGYDEAAVQAHAQKIGDLTERMVVATSRMRAETLQVLTPEQRAELETMKEERRQRWQERKQRKQG